MRRRERRRRVKTVLWRGGGEEGWRGRGGREGWRRGGGGGEEGGV